MYSTLYFASVAVSVAASVAVAVAASVAVAVACCSVSLRGLCL